MKRSRLILSLAMLCIVIALMPVKTEAATTTLNSTDDLRTKVENAADGDIIDLGKQTFTIEEVGASDSSPWSIEKKVTIQNGNIVLRTGGVVLGADVTFSDIEFEFVNRVRNAIIANGYTLALKGTTVNDSALPYHIFCGGISGLSNMPDSGTKGIVNVSGKVEVGNIYAGAVSSDGSAAKSTIPAEININVDTGSSIGVEYESIKKGIYATGAMEFPVNADEMLNPEYVVGNPSPSTEHSVSGNVSVTVNSGLVVNIDGATGSANNAAVTFKDESSVQNLHTVTVTNAASLSAKAGKFVLGENSNLESTDVIVEGTARLGFDEMADPKINSLTGVGAQGDDSQNTIVYQGTIVLGKFQTITVLNEAKGITKVSINEYNSDESEIPSAGYSYIMTRSSADNAFELWPIKNNNGEYALVNSNGTWYAKNIETGPVISSIIIDNGTITSDKDGYLVLPVNAVYLPKEGALSNIYVQVKLNGKTLSFDEEEFGYVDLDNKCVVRFGWNDAGEDVFFVESLEDETSFSAGSYNFEVIVPASNMADNKAHTISFVVNVVDQDTNTQNPGTESGGNTGGEDSGSGDGGNTGGESEGSGGGSAEGGTGNNGGTAGGGGGAIAEPSEPDDPVEPEAPQEPSDPSEPGGSVQEPDSEPEAVTKKKQPAEKENNLIVITDTNKNGTAKVRNVKKTNQKTVRVAPELTVNGYDYKVTVIGERAFKNCKKATKVILPNTIIRVEKYGFTGANNVKLIKFTGKKAPTIKKDAFKGLNTKSMTIQAGQRMSKAQYTKLIKAAKKAGFEGTFKRGK